MARESKDHIRERILAAAHDRFWRFGIKKTTIDEIASDAEVGKGSVYLHFESKEEIAIAILVTYKQEILHEQKVIAADDSLPILDRIKLVLSLPVERANKHCSTSPMVTELITAVKPQLIERTMEIRLQECDLIACLIIKAVEREEMHVDDPYKSASLLQVLSLGFLPLAPASYLINDTRATIGAMVDMMYRGLK